MTPEKIEKDRAEGTPGLMAMHDLEQLLAEAGLYRQIYDMQLKDQEEFVALQDRMAPEAGG